MGSRAWGPGALLIAVCLLVAHILGAEAGIWPEIEIRVTREPSQPQTGENLILTPVGPLQILRSCSWYRRQTRKKEAAIVSTTFFVVTMRQKEGEAYTGRETAGPNCALHIRNLTTLDSGNYTVEKKGYFRLEIGHAYVEVTDRYLSTRSPGIISGITIRSLLAVTAGIGAFLYFVVRNQETPGKYVDPLYPGLTWHLV